MVITVPPEGSATTPASRRLFFALCPDADLRARLDQMLHKRLRIGFGRRVPVANLHITALFLGQVTAQQRPCVEGLGAAVRCAPFTLMLDHVGYWPRPRVLWIGPTHTPPEVFQLVGALRQGVRHCGLVPEDRPFQAHMTLMRKVNRRPAEFAIEPLAWQVASYALMESVSTAQGVEYRGLMSWPLSGASA
jgi:2'-5' RNA ligase